MSSRCPVSGDRAARGRVLAGSLVLVLGTLVMISVVGPAAGGVVAMGSSPAGGSAPQTDWDGGPTAQSENDRFEPNDERAAATPVQPGTVEDLQIVDGESDYFAVNLTSGESITATVEFDDTVGDLDLTVSGPDRDRVEGSYSVTDDERVELTGTVSGTYYIEVYGYSGDTAPYTLGVSVDGDGPDVTGDTDGVPDDGDDPFEDDPDEEDGLDLRSIEIGVTAEGEIDEGDPESDQNRGNYEPVTFNGAAGDVLTISMSSPAGDTYLILRGPDGDIVERNDDGGAGLDSEIRGVQLPEDGEYTVVATSYSSYDTFEYTLSVARGFDDGPRPTTMTLTADAPGASPGDSVTVSFNLTNTANETAPFIVDTDLETRPAGWQITDHSAAGATWRGSDAAFVFPSVEANASVQPSVTLELPANATTREFRASGYAQRGQTAASYTIETDGSG